MSCEQLVANSSRLLAEERANSTEWREHVAASVLTYVFKGICLPTVCAFGIVGNILNLAVLTRKQLQRSMDIMEKSAHLGLVALAVSDLLFCIIAFPIAFVDEEKYKYYENESLLPLYYDLYVKTPVLNMFIISSSWLTVVMASARYLAICLPLHARGFINLTATRIAISAVFLFSLLLNLPLFWLYGVTSFQCAQQCTCYIHTAGVLILHEYWYLAYNIVCAIVGVLVPLIVLAFCNICLIRALRQSSKMQRKYRVNKPKNSGHRITPTLITIVFFFFILVGPSEILDICQSIFLYDSSISKPARHIANFLLACNFSINFVLYCLLNVHFRKTVQFIFCCKWYGKRHPFGKSSTTANNTVTLMTEMETDLL